MLMMRTQIKGVIIRGAKPVIWGTINPLDLQNPLILILTGIKIPTNTLPTASAAIHHAKLTLNPVAVA